MNLLVFEVALGFAFCMGDPLVEITLFADAKESLLGSFFFSLNGNPAALKASESVEEEENAYQYLKTIQRRRGRKAAATPRRKKNR